MRLHRNIHFLLLFLTCLVLVSDLQAQREASVEPVINQIKVKFQGFQPVSDQYVRGNVQLRTGMNYNSTLVDQSIRSLYATNQFEYIEVKVEQADEGKVDVIFIIIPKYTIGKIEFNGNNKFSPERLSSKGEIDSGIPLDEYLVSQAAEKIQEYFVEKHYPDALVDYRISKNDETGYATVTYDIESGAKFKIAEIKFTGVTAFNAKK